MLFYPKEIYMQLLLGRDDLVNDEVGDTAQNERAVTVALGRNFIQNFENDVVEINTIMPFYGFPTHSIYSSQENNTPAGVIKDYNTIEFDGSNVFCLDTTSETIDVEKAYTEANSLLLTYTNKQEEFETLSKSDYNKFYYYRDEKSMWHYTETLDDLAGRTEVLLFIHKNL